MASAPPITNGSTIPPIPGSTGCLPENFVRASFLALPRSYPSLRSGTLAAIYHFQPRVWQRITQYGNVLLLASFGLLAAAWFVSHNEYQYSFRGAVFGYPLISLAYGVLVLAALSPTCFLYRYPSRISSLIAALSYSVYLTHKSLIHLTHQAIGH
jgi:peptidoglycan/LPS O-acetylase OafA/YrhL